MSRIYTLSLVSRFRAAGAAADSCRQPRLRLMPQLIPPLPRLELSKLSAPVVEEGGRVAQPHTPIGDAHITGDPGAERKLRPRSPQHLVSWPRQPARSAGPTSGVEASGRLDSTHLPQLVARPRAAAGAEGTKGGFSARESGPEYLARLLSYRMNHALQRPEANEELLPLDVVTSDGRSAQRGLCSCPCWQRRGLCCHLCWQASSSSAGRGLRRRWQAHGCPRPRQLSACIALAASLLLLGMLLGRGGGGEGGGGGANALQPPSPPPPPLPPPTTPPPTTPPPQPPPPPVGPRSDMVTRPAYLVTFDTRIETTVESFDLQSFIARMRVRFKNRDIGVRVRAGSVIISTELGADDEADAETLVTEVSTLADDSDALLALFATAAVLDESSIEFGENPDAASPPPSGPPSRSEEDHVLIALYCLGAAFVIFALFGIYYKWCRNLPPSAPTNTSSSSSSSSSTTTTSTSKSTVYYKKFDSIPKDDYNALPAPPPTSKIHFKFEM